MAFQYKITIAVAPGDLVKHGPLIPGRVAPFTSRNPKDGIEGFFLIDTGATQFSIDQSVADDLGLISTRTVTSHGLGGAVPIKCYQVMIFIPAKPIGNFPPQATAMLGFPTEVGSVSLHRYHEGLGTLPGRMIGIIGRSLLQFTRTVYDGMTGTLTVETDEAMQYPKKMS